jgi:hypothetical protein
MLSLTSLVGHNFLLHIIHSNQELNLYFHRHDDHDHDHEDGGGGGGGGPFSYPKQECRSNNPCNLVGGVLMHKAQTQNKEIYFIWIRVPER